MLLIIFLGLTAKLTSVSGDCVVETPVLKNFDFIKFSGPRPWYWSLYTPNDSDDDLDCPIATYARPVGNLSLVSTDVYIISEQNHVTLYGNATNWNGSGWQEFYAPPSPITGQAYVIAVDYKRYVILKFCYFQANELYVYVAYRRLHPDKATVMRVQKELQENNLDINQLTEYKTDHCPQVESSDEDEDEDE